jgi:hypothetical protein
MNFIDAVKELSEWRCRGIKQPVWSGFLDRSLRHSETTKQGISWIALNSILNDDWQLVDPIPQTEEVEVVRWMSLNGNGYRASLYTSDNPAEWVKMVGTYTREVKPKVKRREKVDMVRAAHHAYEGHDLYAEWEDAT